MKINPWKILFSPSGLKSNPETKIKKYSKSHLPNFLKD